MGLNQTNFYTSKEITVKRQLVEWEKMFANIYQ